MSVEVITWALSQRVERSSAKFVLVAMANCAGPDGLCWPSLQYLSEATEQDRKTVSENVRRLKDWGFIVATGDHRGATGQVVVYRLKLSENGHVKQAQNRNSSENGTGPKTDTKTPENGHEEARKRTETPPKTVYGTVRNRKEPSGTGKTSAAQPAAVDVADLLKAGIDAETAAEFIAHKARLKAPLTARAWKDHLREAERAGWTPLAAADKVMAKGWRGFEAKYVANEQPASRPAGQPAEPAWRTEQRERMQEALGPYATRRKVPTDTIDMEDAHAPRILG